MENDADWHKTKNMLRRLRRNPLFFKKEGRGYYQGRFIIGRDTPINGGVYLGEGKREAIVVDENKQSSLSTIYQILLSRISFQENNSRSRLSEYELLTMILILVKEYLPSNEKVADEALHKFPDQKIALEWFIVKRGGVCRHQALLAGYLLEKLIKEGWLKGKVSIDRNSLRGEGHSWVRYTNPYGKVFILDVSIGICGELNQVRGYWQYERPEDKKISLIQRLITLLKKLLKNKAVYTFFS